MIDNIDDGKFLHDSSSSSSFLSLMTTSSHDTKQSAAPPPTPVSLSTSSSVSSQLNMQPIIPIYQLQQSTSEVIQNHLNQDLTKKEDVNKNTKIYFEINNDWPGSLMKPTSTRAVSLNRRECKSSSEESCTYDINNHIYNISQTNSKVVKFGDEFLLNTSLKTKLNNGKFGFNPSKFSNSSIKKSFSSYSNQKCLKRLNNSSSQKHFVENINKKNFDFNHNKKLFHAVSNNDLKTVSDLLESSMFDVNCFDDKQRTCLHIACSRGNLDIVRILLEYGANPNIRDCVSNLPIHLAIISSHVAIVTLLLEAGTDIHSLDLNGKTVLHLAGTRLRWLLNDENHKASPKLKFEAIMIMNMIKEYLRRKKTPNIDLDMLANQLENTFNLDDINSLTKEFLNQFEAFNLSK